MEAREQAAEFAGPVTPPCRWLRAELQRQFEDCFGDRAVHGDDDRMLVRARLLEGFELALQLAAAESGPPVKRPA